MEEIRLIIDGQLVIETYFVLVSWWLKHILCYFELYGTSGVMNAVMLIVKHQTTDLSSTTKKILLSSCARSHLAIETLVAMLVQLSRVGESTVVHMLMWQVNGLVGDNGVNVGLYAIRRFLLSKIIVIKCYLLITPHRPDKVWGYIRNIQFPASKCQATVNSNIFISFSRWSRWMIL